MEAVSRNIIGHQKQKKFLSYMVKTGQLPHALLFSGEEQLGKRTVAFELAKTLHCESLAGNNNPCQKCSSCAAITRGIHADLVFVEPSAGQIKIAQIRNVANFLALRSMSGRPKLVIVDNAHQMTVPAQQAFLKTLEEPQGNSIIILVTSKPHLLLPTVLSRVQQIKFFPVSIPELVDFFREKNVPVEEVQSIIKLSARRPGAALELLGDPKRLIEREKTLKDIQALCKAGLHQRFNWAQDMAKNKQDIPETLELWLRFFRGMLLAKMFSRIRIRQLPDYSVAQLQGIIRSIQEVDFAISDSNANPRLALDVLMLEL